MLESLALVFSLGSVLFWAQAPPDVLPTDPESNVSATLRQLPHTPEELKQRAAWVANQLARLKPATQPASAPADEASTARLVAQTELFGAWESYRGQLQRAVELHDQIAQLTSDAHLQQFTAALAEQEAAAAEVRDRRRPARERAQEAETLRATEQRLQAQQVQLTDAIQRRTALLADGLAQRRAQLEESLKALRAQLGQIDAVTTAPADPTTRSASYERVLVQLAETELALANLPREEQRAQLRLPQDQRLLAAVQTHLAAVQERLAGFAEVASRGRVAELQQQRARTDDPVERALLDLELFVEQILDAYFPRFDRATATDPSVVGRADQRLRERVAFSKSYWMRIADSLDYGRRDTGRVLAQQVRREIGTFTRGLTELQSQQGDALARLRELQTVQDRAVQRFATLREQLNTALDEAQPEQRARTEAAVTTLRTRLVEDMRPAIEQAEHTITQIDERIELLTEHLDVLREVDQQLYWQRVQSRDAGLLGADWRAAGRELMSLFGAGPPGDATAESARDQLERQLFGYQRNTRAQSERVISAVRNTLNEITRSDWLWAGGLLLAAAILGALLYRGARRRSIPLARTIEAEFRQAQAEGAGLVRGLSGRINLMGLNLVGDLALPLLIAAALAYAAVRLVADETVENAVLLVLVLLAGAVTLLRSVQHLFEAGHRPHRPLPCADAVALHYRAWLTAFVLVSLIVLIIPLLLVVTGVGLALPNAFFAVYKTIILLMLLGFLFRKQRVLQVFGRDQANWTSMIASAFYPVLFVVVLGLLALQVIGYGALVTYAATGLLLSAITIVVGATVSEYIADLVDHYYRAEPAGHEAEDAATELAASRTHYVLLLVKGLARLAGLALIVLGGLWIWNVPVQMDWLNLNTLGAGALVILIALVLDRLAFTALFALSRSGRLPETTTNLLQRWLRGVLAILVVLALIAVAGWQIDSVVTFLTTVLAMIAIGFVAVWSVLSNVLATLIVLIWRPFNVGEHIEIQPDGLTGQVIDINFMYTVLKSDDGGRISVPNNIFAQKYIQRKPLRGGAVRTLAEQLASDTPLGE